MVIAERNSVIRGTPGVGARVSLHDRLSVTAQRGIGCELTLDDGRRLLDLYAAEGNLPLGYGHLRLCEAIQQQSQRLLYQDESLTLDVREQAAAALVDCAPDSLGQVLFANSGTEANEYALRIAFLATGRSTVLAVTGGEHGNSAATAALSQHSARQPYAYPRAPFNVDFIPRNDVSAVRTMVGHDVAAVIFEPVQAGAGVHDLSFEFVAALREATRSCAALLVADEMHTSPGRCGRFFAVETCGIEPDMLTAGMALGGGVPSGALLMRDDLATLLEPGDLQTTIGGGPLAAAAMLAVIEAIRDDNLLANVRRRESEIREFCAIGPVQRIRGAGLLLGLVCDRPAAEVRAALLQHDILAGLTADADVLRLAPPLNLQSHDVGRLADALAQIVPSA